MGTKSKFYVDVMSLNEEVTGSCHLCVVKTPNKETIKFIVDCGLFQEEQYYKYNTDFPFNPDEISFALVTHNHVDHIGRLPLLARQNFNNFVYTTELTKVLMREALQDTCKILGQVAKRNHTSPLYEVSDLEIILNHTKGCKYLKEIQVHKNIFVTFLENGHLMGASMILVRICYPEEDDINILFTGDYSANSTFFNVSPIPKHILDLPLTIVQESTYGDTYSENVARVFERNVINAVNENKTIIIPVFSLGRSQELLLAIKKLQNSGELDTNIPIYLDGKLSIIYTNIYLRNCSLFKEEAKEFLPCNFNFVNKESRENLLNDRGTKIILTSSGMGSYGPAPLYISNYISSQNALIHFVGYPAVGTLSRKLKDTQKGDFVKIGNVLKQKFCDIEYTAEFSSHAKLDELLEFLKQFNDIKLLLVNHGENICKENLARQAITHISPKEVAIESRSTFFRIGRYGLLKELSTRFL